MTVKKSPNLSRTCYFTRGTIPLIPTIHHSPEVSPPELPSLMPNSLIADSNQIPRSRLPLLSVKVNSFIISPPLKRIHKLKIQDDPHASLAPSVYGMSDVQETGAGLSGVGPGTLLRRQRRRMFHILFAAVGIDRHAGNITRGAARCMCSKP